MSLVKGLQRTIIRWMRSKHPARDKVEIKNFEKIKKVCLLTSLSQTDSPEILRQTKALYAKQNKIINMMVYVPSKELPDDLVASDYQVLTKKDLNKIGLLKKDILNSIKKQSYDLFICYNPGTTIPLEQAAGFVDALVNVGLKAEKGFEPDITIHPKSPGMIHFLETVNNYLQNINKTL